MFNDRVDNGINPTEGRNVPTLSLTSINDDSVLTSFSREAYSAINLARVRTLKQMFESRTFYQGDHVGYASFLMSAPNPTFVNKYNRKVDLASTLIETKRNIILQSEPKPSVSEKIDPLDLNTAKIVSMAVQNILDEVLDAEQYQAKLLDYVLNGLVDGVGFFELTNDSNGIHLNIRKFEDILTPLDIQFISESPIVGKRFSGNIGKYLANPEYKNIDKLNPKQQNQDMDFVDLAYKSLGTRFTDYSFPVKSLNDFEGVQWQSIINLTNTDINALKNKYDWINKKEPGDQIMRVWAISGGYVIYDKYIDCSSYYLYPYNPLGGSFYEASYFSRLISMNKGYDVTWTVMEEYAAFAMKYRILVERNTNITEITNQNGNIIRWEGEQPEEMAHSDLSPGFFDLLSKYESTMQIMAGVSPSSLSLPMSGEKKFKAMETSKLQDSFNAKAMNIRLKNSLTEMTKGILDLVADSYDLKDLAYERGDGIHTIKVAGEKYFKDNPTKMASYLHSEHKMYKNRPASADAPPEPELVIIKKDYPVEISVIYGLDYTEASVQQQLLEMAKTEAPENPVIPIEAWVDAMDLDKIKKYIDQAKREKKLKDSMNPPQTSQSNNTQNGSSPIMPPVMGSPSNMVPSLNPPTNIGGAGVPGGQTQPQQGQIPDLQNLFINKQPITGSNQSNVPSPGMMPQLSQ